MPSDSSITPAPTQAAPASVADVAPFVATPDMIREHAVAQPDRIAVTSDDRSITWRELESRMNRVARALATADLGKGDRVAVLAGNSIEHLEIILGTVRAGLCAVPLSTMGTPEAIAGMVEDSDSRALFLAAPYDSVTAPIESRLRRAVQDRCIAIGFSHRGWQDYETLVRAHSDAPFRVEIAPDDDYNIIYSSGTTGAPKGIIQTHRLRSQLRQRLVPFGYGPDTVSLVSTPIHSNTTIAGLLPTLQHGGRVVLMQRFEARRFLELAERERVTHAMMVPVQIQRILAHPDFDRFDLSSFRMKLCMAAPFRAQLKAECQRRWPGRLVEMYGLTESGTACVLDVDQHPGKLHTVGRPGMGCLMKIIDADGRVLPQGEIGEIVSRTAMMMKGYHKQPDRTEELLWHDADGLIYFRSGDMGRFDADGFLELLDRRKDLIISGGLNLYPADIEEVLLQHPDVADAAVIGIPSEQWGETPLALVVRQPGSDPIASELLAWANTRLARTQRLAGVEYRDELPRSPIGKLLKRELRAPYWKEGTAKV